MKHKKRNFKNKQKYINSLKWLHSEKAKRLEFLLEIAKNDLMDYSALKDNTLTILENLDNIEELLNAHKRL